MKKYELYSKVNIEGSKPLYIFLCESDTIDDIYAINKEQDSIKIIINNYYPITLIDYQYIPKEKILTDEYRTMILECKISKHTLAIEYMNNKTIKYIFSRIEQEIKNAEKETEEYFIEIKKAIASV